MPRYIDAEPFDKMCVFAVSADERPVDAVFRMIYEAPTIDLVSRDLISRQDAIDIVEKWFAKIGLNGDICLDGLRSLPSADVIIEREEDENAK